MRRDGHATARVFASFEGAPPATRAFVAARLANMPLGALDRELRALRGRVLSLGCGFGVVERYLAEINPEVQIDGLELDAERVAVAERTQAAAPRVRVRAQDVRALALGPAGYDAALAFDVMHHVPKADHAAIAGSLLAALRPGGTLLVKDIATTPVWKHRFNQIHDRVVTGETTVDARAPEEMAALLEDAGFERRGSRRVGRLSPYPHYLLELRRPPAASRSRNGSSGTR